MKRSTNENLHHSMKDWLASWMSIPASNWLLLKLCCTKFALSTNPSTTPTICVIQSVPVIGPSSSQQMSPSWESAKYVTDCVRIHTLISILDLDNEDESIEASNFLFPWLLFGFCQWSKWYKIYSFLKLQISWKEDLLPAFDLHNLFYSQQVKSGGKNWKTVYSQ